MGDDARSEQVTDRRKVDPADTTRLGYELLNRGDHDAFAELLCDEVEWTPIYSPGLGSETFRGRLAVRGFFAGFAETFESLTMEPLEILVNGERVFVAVRVRARDPRLEMDIAQVNFHALTFHQGLLLRMRSHVDRRDALVETGLA